VPPPGVARTTPEEEEEEEDRPFPVAVVKGRKQNSTQINR